MKAAQKSIDLDPNPTTGRGKSPDRPAPKRRPRRKATVTRLNIPRDPDTVATERPPTIGIWAY